MVFTPTPEDIGKVLGGVLGWWSFAYYTDPGIHFWTIIFVNFWHKIVGLNFFCDKVNIVFSKLIPVYKVLVGNTNQGQNPDLLRKVPVENKFRYSWLRSEMHSDV